MYICLFSIYELLNKEESWLGKKSFTINEFSFMRVSYNQRASVSVNRYKSLVEEIERTWFYLLSLGK
jgi:hypothetical protein